MKIMAFLIASILVNTAAFAATGPQGKADCKEILDKVKAAKAAASSSSSTPATSAPAGSGGSNTGAQ